MTDRPWSTSQYKTLDREVDHFICQLLKAKNRTYQDVLHKVRAILGHHADPEDSTFTLSIDSEERLFHFIQELASCPCEWKCELGTGKTLTIKVQGCKSEMLWVRVYNYYAQRITSLCASMYGYKFVPPYWFPKRKEENDGEETPDSVDP